MTKGQRSKRQLSKSFTVVIQPLSTRLIKPNFCFDLSHRRSTTVSLETRNLFIYLFSCLILIGCKEVARFLSEARGVSGAEARVITATLRSRNNNFMSFISLEGE